MPEKGKAARVMMGGLLAAACLIGASCEPAWNPRAMHDYIGPAQRTAPAGGDDANAPATGAALPEIPADGPIPLDVTRATVLALGNNKALLVEKYNPPIRRSAVEQQRSAFDPVLTARASDSRTRDDRSEIDGPDTLTKTGSAELGVKEYLPTGTSLDLKAGATYSDTDPSADEHTSRLELTASQALLRGFGPAVNLASLRQARLAARASQYNLRGFAESLVARTEQAYWDYTLAVRQIEIVQRSLDLAQQQADETAERIRVGRLAETERAAADAEVARRREELINARSDAENARLDLLRLISPPDGEPLDRAIAIGQQPVSREQPPDPLGEHLQLARRMRPDLNEARLQVQSGDLEIVKTRNGLLPKLDLFITLGKTGYANSFGEAWADLSGQSYDVLVGISGEYPPLNRDARARHLAARLSRAQQAEAVDNLSQLVGLDVRKGYVEVLRFQEQVVASAATRRLQEEALRAETEKFRVGRSTSLQVAQSQRDLLAAQIAEIQAVVNSLKAAVELYRLDGSLLLRRSIACPGAEPVEGGAP